MATVTMMWQVRLFNGPALVDASGTETRRFRSHKVGALLAYLALNLGRPCPREELYEALWPEENTQVVANRFRVTLASLRRQLEPEGVPFGAVLDVSETGRVRLRAETVACDTAECERLLRSGLEAQAARLVTGPLLPGYYEDWAVTEQTRWLLLTEDLAGAHSAPLPHSGNSGTEMRPAPYEPLRSRQAEPGHSDVSVDVPINVPIDVPNDAPVPARHNASLPLYLTRFFGRESELQNLHDLLQAHRLVSLIGMGGMGKTRLGVEIARAWDGECRFVSLVPLPNGGRLYDTILKSLGVAPQTDAPTDEQLIRLLNRRDPLLLILDNAEHLSAAVASLTLRLLAEVPGLRLLVTSRQRLDIAGEAVLLLAALEAPGPPAQAARLLEFAAVSLFVDRAKNARPDFTLSARNAPAVADICRRLEGIPLALELAAARITSQTPQQIALSLETRLTDLKSHQHGLSPRHQSLRAVIQGSLDLLSEEQRTFFTALAVFQGSFSYEAAQSVSGYAETEEFLNHLTLCSLVVVREEERMGTMRYTLLETLRQLAMERLTTEQQETYRERHARFYIDMAAYADKEDFRFMDRLEADHENLLAAMEWYWKHDRATLLPLLQDILNLWANRGYHRLALEWIARAFPKGERIAPEYKQGMFRVYVDVGRYQEAEEIVRLAEQDMGDPIQITWVSTCWGYVRMLQGVWNEAVTYQRRAVEAAHDIPGEQRGMIVRLVSSNAVLALLGRAEYLPDNPDPMQDFREAERYARSGYAGLQEGSRLQSSYYHHLMCALWGQNQEAEGDACFARALEIALSHRHLTALIRILGDGAFRLAAKGCAGESVQFLSAAEALREKMGYRAALYFAVRAAKHLQTLQTQLGGEVFDRHWQSGQYTPLEVLIPAVLPKILSRKIT